MKNRDKVLGLLIKIYQLVTKGINGEKESAKTRFDTIFKKYTITIKELRDYATNNNIDIVFIDEKKTTKRTSKKKTNELANVNHELSLANSRPFDIFIKEIKNDNVNKNDKICYVKPDTHYFHIKIPFCGIGVLTDARTCYNLQEFRSEWNALRSLVNEILTKEGNNIYDILAEYDGYNDDDDIYDRFILEALHRARLPDQDLEYLFDFMYKNSKYPVAVVYEFLNRQYLSEEFLIKIRFLWEHDYANKKGLQEYRRFSKDFLNKFKLTDDNDWDAILTNEEGKALVQKEGFDEVYDDYFIGYLPCTLDDIVILESNIAPKEYGYYDRHSFHAKVGYTYIKDCVKCKSLESLRVFNKEKFDEFYSYYTTSDTKYFKSKKYWNNIKLVKCKVYYKDILDCWGGKLKAIVFCEQLDVISVTDPAKKEIEKTEELALSKDNDPMLAIQKAAEREGLTVSQWIAKQNS